MTAMFRQQRTVVTLGCQTEDGTVVECIFDPTSMSTSLVYMKGSKWFSVNEFIDQKSNIVYKPYPPEIIRAHSFVLPTKYGKVLSPTEILDGVEKLIRSYLILDEDDYKIVAGYIIATYFNDRFSKFGYLRFVGPQGSGKSHALSVCRRLAYHAGSHAASQSGPTLFRTLGEFPNSTLFNDEAEEYKYSGSTHTLNKVMKHGFEKDGKVPRTGRRSEKVDIFSCYGPKIIASTGFFTDPPLESRFITCNMKPAKAKSIPMFIPEIWEEANEWRNNLLAYRLANFEKVKAQEPSDDLCGFNLRALEINLPIQWSLLQERPPEFLIKSIKKCTDMNPVEGTIQNDAKLANIAAMLLEEKKEKVTAKEINKKIMEKYRSEMSNQEINNWMTMFGVFKRQTSAHGNIYHLNTINKPYINAKYGLKIQ